MSPDLLMLSLLGAPLFSGLAPLQLKVLALTAERVSFRDGEALIRGGEEGDAAYPHRQRRGCRRHGGAKRTSARCCRPERSSVSWRC